MENTPLTLELLLTIAVASVTIVATVAGSVWGLIRHLEGKREKGDTDLHRRIDTVKSDLDAKTSEFVRQSDYRTDQARHEKEIAELRAAISTGFSQTQARLDTIFMHITRHFDTRQD